VARGLRVLDPWCTMCYCNEHKLYQHPKLGEALIAKTEQFISAKIFGNANPTMTNRFCVPVVSHYPCVWTICGVKFLEAMHKI